MPSDEARVQQLEAENEQLRDDVKIFTWELKVVEHQLASAEAVVEAIKDGWTVKPISLANAYIILRHENLNEGNER